MATSHVWHKLHLHRSEIARRLLLVGLVVGLPLASQAQKKSGTTASRGSRGQVKSITVQNLVAYDDKWFHPGMYIAPSFSRYIIEQSVGYTQTRQVSANSIVSPGLSVGFIADVRLAPNFNLRFTPGASFVTRRIEFKPYGYPKPDSIFTQELGGTQIDFPLLLKFTADRRRNSRLYVVGGVKSSVGVGNRRKDPARNLLRATATDLSIEYGVGMDLFYPLFKFGPELRFSNGLIDQLISGKDIYSRSLQSMKTNTVTLYLNIE